MPLSPPLTPLSTRFPPPAQASHAPQMMPHSPQFAAAANFLLAAQHYNPFFAIRGQRPPSCIPPSLTSVPNVGQLELLENLHRLMQIKQAEFRGASSGFGAFQEKFDKMEKIEVVRIFFGCLL